MVGLSVCNHISQSASINNRLSTLEMEVSKANSIISIAALVGFLVQKAAGTTFIHYKIMKNTRAELDILSLNKSLDFSECTLICTQTEGCNMANWLGSTCELLRDPAGGMTLYENPNAQFFCKYSHL